MVRLYEPIVGPLDFIEQGDGRLMMEPIDFFGVNFYKRNKVKEQAGTLLGYKGIDDPQPGTLDEWKKYPDVLLGVLRMIRNEYTQLPIIITENGLGLDSEEGSRSDATKFGTYITVKDEYDTIAPDGCIHDDARIAYVHNCLRQCLDFIDEGGNLKGYYLWSFMDNFEWALGYSKRFGITYVDFETLKRTVKDSGWWYADVIKRRSL
jgi:beta-glucosidase